MPIAKPRRQILSQRRLATIFPSTRPCDNCNLPTSIFFCTRFVVYVVIQPTGRTLRPFYLTCGVAWRPCISSSLQEVRLSTFHNSLRTRFVVFDLPPSVFCSRHSSYLTTTYHKERCNLFIWCALWRQLAPNRIHCLKIANNRGENCCCCCLFQLYCIPLCLT